MDISFADVDDVIDTLEANDKVAAACQASVAKKAAPIAGPAAQELITGHVTCEDGGRLYYEVNGLRSDQATLVVVNNYFMTAVQWRQFVGDLRTKFPVLSYDLRNQGQSSRSEGEQRLEAHVADLHDLLGALKLDKVVLMGTCISTLIVADYALKYPRQVEKLVFTGAVMNPLGYRAHDFLHKSLLGSLRRGGAEALFDHYYPLLYTSRTIQAWGTPGYLVSKSRFLENNPAEMLERHLAGSVKLKFDCEQLRKLTMPALFISGEDDPMTRPSIVSLLTRRMAKAQAVYIPNSGHNPYIETPVEFQNAVYSFMADKG